jgi:hypothetical protein
MNNNLCSFYAAQSGTALIKASAVDRVTVSDTMTITIVNKTTPANEIMGQHNNSYPRYNY